MQIAYFVMAHRKPAQLEWLISAIAPSSDLVLLHVDMKSRLGLKRDRQGIWAMARALSERYPSVRLMRSRFTNWGGWSLSKLLLEAIDVALDADADWQYFINLSGQDYPIQHQDALKRALANSGEQVFVEIQPFSGLPKNDWHLQWRHAMETPLKVIPGRRGRKPPSGFTLDAKGSQWVMLPRSFCEWQRRSATRLRIERYLRRHFLSDELIMQSLVANSPWRDRIAPCYGREILWPGHTVTMEDWDRLVSSPGFFARKFDVTVDPELTPRMAAHLSLSKIP